MVVVGLLVVALVTSAGCKNGLQRVDRQLDQLLNETSASMGQAGTSPSIKTSRSGRSGPEPGNRTAEHLSTVNPSAEDLTFTPLSATDEAEDALERLAARLDRYNVLPDGTIVFGISDALAYAFENSPDYLSAEEDYIFAGLLLLIERHEWGPRFFNDVTAGVSSLGNGGMFDSALNVVNDFRVTQRLPYGGEVSARALATATEDLHQRVVGERVQSIDLILEARIPLLRGAGTVARESRIQAERNVVYAARAFERFRRGFVFDVSREFLDLVVQKQAIANAERQVASFEELEEREQGRVTSGRDAPFQLSLAQQDTAFALDRVAGQRENFRLAVDRFKVRIGMAIGLPLDIDIESTLHWPTPDVNLDEAVMLAMTYRLDLQTRRDQVDDDRRAVDNAYNSLLPDLTLTGSATIPGDDTRGRSGLRVVPDDSALSAGVMLSLPLDRQIERVRVREAEVQLQRSIRDYNTFRDGIVVDVRNAVRQIDRALFSLKLQQENIRIAERRQEQIDEAPDRAEARDRSEAIDDQLRALDEYDEAQRNLSVAILRYLEASGQLRVNAQGVVQPPKAREPEPADPVAAPAGENAGM